MTGLELGFLALGVVVPGVTAVHLLIRPSPRSTARRRLAALSREAPAPPLPGRLGRLVTRAAAPALLGLAALAVAGPVAGVGAGVMGGCLVWWRRRRCDACARRAERARVVAELPLAIDLVVAGLRAGCTMEDVLAAVTAAVGGPLGRLLGESAERLRLGADPASVWRELGAAPELAPMGRAMARAADTGAPVADILERHAAEARRSAQRDAFARSQRLGVLVVAPLGLCFLPAFVLIGVVPLAAGLISELVPR
ncbi:type II secretion system F family protein [Nocardiopsis rhodophaea]|uniref:type II secretion system F family protein n=1 Tax=Nocardiopsis rhodophaea TaxID=280238 RepID=UPI0031D2AA4F